MGRLVEYLFLVAGALLPPVLLLLSALGAWTTWALGGLLREGLDRARVAGPWRRLLGEIERGLGPGALSDRFEQLPLEGGRASFRDAICRTEADAITLRKRLTDIELGMARRLAALSFSVRVGPMLGLIGTLLPLGPALRGLASQDMAGLAENLEIAFTTTVLGLLIGGLAYAAYVLRRNWYDTDLSDLEFVLEATRPGASRHRAIPDRVVEDADAQAPLGRP